jgi:hypothetical protein
MKAFRRRFVHAGIATASLVVLVQCGGGNGAKAPTQPSPSVTGLAVLPAGDLVKVGGSVDLVLQATYSNGTTESMSATWTSSNDAVARVSNGRVTAIGPGEAVIAAECPHGRATTSIRVVPDYQGSWGGEYRMLSCRTTGDMAREDFCDLLDVPSTAPIGLQLDQNRAQVTGTIALGSLSGGVNGEIAVTGHVGLRGSVRYEESGVTVTISLADWDTVATGAQMTGRFRQVWTATAATGSMEIGCELQPLTRAAASARATRSLAPPLGSTRLERLVNALRRR